MKLFSLKIAGPEAYDSWSGLRGNIEFRDETGTALKMVLKPGQISRILKVLEKELPDQAKESVRGVAQATADAIDGGLLLENDGNVTLNFN